MSIMATYPAWVDWIFLAFVVVIAVMVYEATRRMLFSATLGLVLASMVVVAGYTPFSPLGGAVMLLGGASLIVSVTYMVGLVRNHRRKRKGGEID